MVGWLSHHLIREQTIRLVYGWDSRSPSSVLQLRGLLPEERCRTRRRTLVERPFRGLSSHERRRLGHAGERIGRFLASQRRSLRVELHGLHVQGGVLLRELRPREPYLSPRLLDRAHPLPQLLV